MKITYVKIAIVLLFIWSNTVKAVGPESVDRARKFDIEQIKVVLENELSTMNEVPLKFLPGVMGFCGFFVGHWYGQGIAQWHVRKLIMSPIVNFQHQIAECAVDDPRYICSTQFVIIIVMTTAVGIIAHTFRLEQGGDILSRAYAACGELCDAAAQRVGYYVQYAVKSVRDKKRKIRLAQLETTVTNSLSKVIEAEQFDEAAEAFPIVLLFSDRDLALKIRQLFSSRAGLEPAEALSKLLYGQKLDYCVICLSEELAANNIQLLKCGHMFCRECLNDYKGRSLACPVCRRTTVNDPHCTIEELLEEPAPQTASDCLLWGHERC